MNQQQLQIARSALWHQTASTDPSAPLRTLDDAAQWLDDIGFCLFLPRHTQLPAPAPSFVEACVGAPSVTPAPAAIAQATELLARLVEDRRIVPLNLLGTFSEQPDFLLTPEILPWVAAVRGDRQWKAAPGGRTSPIVLRTWEALDREGELTSVQLREILGREITEAAALRALMELWTGLRAMPIAAQDKATRWTLLKNRFATELATGANTSQTIALSALLSLYLRSAVAATAEEAEVFLSPLTARSRIRDVLHGMMASRQIATTPVATQTQLFLEGSLPETEAAPEPERPKQISRPLPPVTFTKSPARKGPRPTRWELPPREAQPAARPQADPNRPWQKKPAAAHRPQAGSDRPRREDRRPAGPRPVGQQHAGPRPTGPRPSGPRPVGPRPSGPRPTGLRPAGPRPTQRPAGPRPAGSRSAFGRGLQQRPRSGAPRQASAGDKPWQRQKNSFGNKPFPRKFPQESGEASPVRPRPESPSKPEFRPRPEYRRASGARPAPSDRPARKAPGRGGSTRPAPFGKNRKAPGDRPWRERPQGPPQNRPRAPFRKDASSEPTQQGQGQGQVPARRPWRDRPAPPGDRTKSPSAGGARPDRPSRPFRPGKPFAGKPGRPPGRGFRPRPSGPAKNKFRKPSPAERKPRKNRSQEETPE